MDKLAQVYSIVERYKATRNRTFLDEAASLIRFAKEMLEWYHAPQAQEEPSGAPAPAIVEPDERYSVFSHGGPRGVICAVSDGGDVFIRPDATREELHTALLAILSDEGVPLPEPQPPAPASPGGPRTHSAGVLECLGYAMSIIEMTASALKAPASEGGMPNSPLLPQLRHAYESLKAARDFPDLAPAAPEAGAPGTQGACLWTEVADGDGYFESSCGVSMAFQEGGGPKDDADYIHCQKCGKKIELDDPPTQTQEGGSHG